MLNNLKNNVSAIHWPSKKTVIKKTSICIVSTVILSTAIACWTNVVEHVVNFLMSL